MKNKNILKVSKQVEIKSTKKTVIEPKESSTEPKFDFDTWFTVRRNDIPKHHHKEIIKADFKARGLPALCTMQEFDSALEKYGLKLA